MVVHVCNPSYLEAEAGELLEPRRQRLHSVLLHSSLGNIARPHIKGKQKQNKIIKA